MEPGTARMYPWQGEVLQRALDLKSDQRLPHAVLLDTPSLYQIEELAKYLSMLMLCDAPDGLAICGSCEACRMMSAGTYADFNRVTLEIDEKTKKLKKNISIGQVRNLIHELSLTRKHDRLKIAVIFPAETMNKNSANALLKTLEEPAANVLLVLLTNNPGRIPVTIRSRCQLWSIHSPSFDTAQQWLHSQGFDADDVEQYLQFASADPLLALELKQQDFAQQVDAFKSRLSAFLRGSQSASELARSLSGDNSTVRRLISMTLDAYCLKTGGVSTQPGSDGNPEPAKARQMLDLRARAQQQLRVEENNLDFQIQLEDVLISLKQILTRRSI